jgi:hypothetical protein
MSHASRKMSHWNPLFFIINIPWHKIKTGNTLHQILLKIKRKEYMWDIDRKDIPLYREVTLEGFIRYESLGSHMTLAHSCNPSYMVGWDLRFGGS